MTGKQWLDRPVLPYLLLAVSPVLTLPIGTVILLSLPDCGVDEPWWELRYFEIALLPALADLFPFLWPASRKPTVRKAAIVAGLIGSARYEVPQVSTLIYSVFSGGQVSNQTCSVSSFFVAAALIPLILGLWLVSALAVAVILLRAARRAPVSTGTRNDT